MKFCKGAGEKMKAGIVRFAGVFFMVWAVAAVSPAVCAQEKNVRSSAGGNLKDFKVDLPPELTKEKAEEVKRAEENAAKEKDAGVKLSAKKSAPDEKKSKNLSAKDKRKGKEKNPKKKT